MQPLQAPSQHGSLLLRHKVLAVLLSHPSISCNQGLLCSLLMTCQTMSAAVNELVGAVPLTFKNSNCGHHVPGMADWISKRGHVLHGKCFCSCHDVLLTAIPW